MEHILAAFEKGIDGVLVAGCLEGGCHFLEGNLRARKRTDRIREILDEIGVGGERLKMVNLSSAMAPTFVQRVEEIVETVRALGPNPLRASRHIAETKVSRMDDCTSASIRACHRVSNGVPTSVVSSGAMTNKSNNEPAKAKLSVNRSGRLRRLLMVDGYGVASAGN